MEPSMPVPGDNTQATHRSQLPTSVYRYYDKVDLLIYVGITNRGAQRNGEHNTGKEWWPFVVRQEVEHYPNRGAAAIRERELIRRYCPPFNTQHNPQHVVMREAYFKVQGGLESPRAHLEALHEKRVDLDIHEHHDTDLLTFRTPLRHAPIVSALQLPKEQVRVYGLGRPTWLHGIDIVGPFAVLVVNKQRAKWPIKHAYMVVNYVHGPGTIVVRVVQCVVDQYARAHAISRPIPDRKRARL